MSKADEGFFEGRHPRQDDRRLRPTRGSSRCQGWGAVSMSRHAVVDVVLPPTYFMRIFTAGIRGSSCECVALAEPTPGSAVGCEAVFTV
eukprot:scaffold112273_cov69-Phaeocystis_antarctica.AAC.1